MMSARSRSESKRQLSPARRRIFQALTVILSLLTCLACLEIGLKLFGPEYYRFNNRSYEYYSNPRGYFDVRRMEGDRAVYGLRCFEGGSPPRRIPAYLDAPKDIVAFLERKDTILGLGDSFAYGRGVRYEDTYLWRLERMLARDGKPVTIRNAAWCGYDLKDIRDVYGIHSKPRQYPLVIYGFVLNDFGLPGIDQIVGSDYIDLNNGGIQYNIWREGYATVNMACHLIETFRLDRITRKAYIEAFRGKNADDGFGHLESLAQSIRADGGHLVIVLFPLLYDFQDYDFQEIHDKMADFSRKESIPLLDLLPAYSKHKAKELWVHPTDHHPNEIAHQIAAEEIHAFLQHEDLLGLLPSE